MPRTPFSIAKTHKDVILQKFLDDDLNSLGSAGSTGAPLIYYGRTTNATLTELFIGGKLQTGSNNVRRLYLPETSAVIFTAFALAYNVTDDIIQLASHYKGGVKNTANTVAEIKDYETTTGGNQAFSVDPAFSAGATPLFQGLSYAFASDVVTFTADNTNKALAVNVTGTAAKTLLWKVYLHCYTISQTSDRFYGDAASGVGT